MASVLKLFHFFFQLHMKYVQRQQTERHHQLNDEASQSPAQEDSIKEPYGQYYMANLLFKELLSKQRRSLCDRFFKAPHVDPVLLNLFLTPNILPELRTEDHAYMYRSVQWRSCLRCESILASTVLPWRWLRNDLL